MGGSTAAGSLQVVATDHCAFTTEVEALRHQGLHQDPERAAGGLEDRLAVLWTRASRPGGSPRTSSWR